MIRGLARIVERVRASLPNPKRGIRRGGTMVEFALIAPILMMVVGAMADYGYYFYREDLIINVLQEAARTGGLKKQIAGEAENACAACVAGANAAATAGLTAMGVTGASPGATIVRVPAAGTPCSYAIQMAPSIANPRFFGFVPTPPTIRVRVLAMAQNLQTCT
jgi:Flp pilus assembly protein TadG